jgi:tetratricopeptide (TPR) repeat protein
MSNRFSRWLGRRASSPAASNAETSTAPVSSRRDVVLGRMQEAIASRQVRVGVMAFVLGLALLLVLPRLLPGVSSEEFLVLVAPFETTSAGTGTALANDLARALEDGSQGRIVAQVLDAPPSSVADALALAQRRGADLVVYGTAEPGALLNQESLQPSIVYQPTGSFAPVAWQGYQGRFAIPQQFTLATRPINGAVVMPQVVRALNEYGAGRVDRALQSLDALGTQGAALRPELPHMLRANIEWARGDFRAAAELYRRAIGDASQPDAALLYNNLGAVLQDAGDPSAREAFNQAIVLLDRQNRDLGELRYNLALEALRDNKPAAATSTFEAIGFDRAEGLLEPFTPLLLDASRAYRLDFQLDEADAVLTSARERAAIDDVLTTPELRDMLILRLNAAVLAERSQLDLAREVSASGPVLWELQAREPLRATLVNDLENQIRSAINQSRRAIDLWSRRSAAEDAANNTVAGRIALAQAQRDAASLAAHEQFKTVLDIERLRSSGVRPNGGVEGFWALLTGTGSPVSPIRERLEQRFVSEPNNPEPHLLLGTAHLVAGEEDAAREQFEIAQRLAPQAPEPPYGLAMVALPEDPAQARALLTRSVALEPLYFPARLRLAELAASEQDWATAIEQREWLAQQRPSDDTTLALATVLRLSGEGGYARAEAVLLPLANQNNPRALIELAELYRSSGNLPAARRVLERAQQAAPRGSAAYPDVAYETGRLLVAENNIAEAEAQFEAALSAEPRHIPSLLALAQINRTRPQVATRHYRAALDAGADNPAELERIGQQLLAYREYDLAVTAFERAIDAAPQDPAAHYGLALASLRLEDLDRAEAAAREAITVAGGTYPRAQTVLGDVALKRGDIAGATEAYNVALRQNDSLAAGYIGLGRAAAAEGRWAVATGHFRNAVAREPTSAEAYLWLGEALMREPNNNPRDAATAYAAAIARRPDYAEAYLGLAQAQIQLGDIPQAEDSLERAIALQPEYAEAFLVRGRLAEQQAQDNRAIEDYGRAIGAGDRLAEPRFRRALLSIRANRIDDARGDLERAIEIQPNFPEAHYWLGRANFAQQRYDAAVENFRQAVGQQPEFAEARFYQGLAEERSGRPAEALISFRTTIEVGAGTIWAGEAQKALDRLAAQ